MTESIGSKHAIVCDDCQRYSTLKIPTKNIEKNPVIQEKIKSLIKILDDVTLPSKYSPSNSRFNRNKPIIFFLITGGIIGFALFFGYKQNVEPNADIPAKSIGQLRVSSYSWQ